MKVRVLKIADMYYPQFKEFILPWRYCYRTEVVYDGIETTKVWFHSEIEAKVYLQQLFCKSSKNKKIKKEVVCEFEV